jgi:hypothetical protein
MMLSLRVNGFRSLRIGWIDKLFCIKLCALRGEIFNRGGRRGTQRKFLHYLKVFAPLCELHYIRNRTNKLHHEQQNTINH